MNFPSARIHDVRVLVDIKAAHCVVDHRRHNSHVETVVARKRCVWKARLTKLVPCLATARPCVRTVRFSSICLLRGGVVLVERVLQILKFDTHPLR